jgi:hypothetical protein
MTTRVDNSSVTETFQSSALVPFWCAGGVVAKGARVGFMTAPAGSADGADTDQDSRSHRHVRCGTVTGFRTTGESGNELVVIRVDNDGTGQLPSTDDDDVTEQEQRLAVDSLVPSSRVEEGGRTAGAAAVGIVAGAITVAPILTFQGETLRPTRLDCWPQRTRG